MEIQNSNRTVEIHEFQPWMLFGVVKHPATEHMKANWGRPSHGLLMEKQEAMTPTSVMRHHRWCTEMYAYMCGSEDITIGDLHIK